MCQSRLYEGRAFKTLCQKSKWGRGRLSPNALHSVRHDSHVRVNPVDRRSDAARSSARAVICDAAAMPPKPLCLINLLSTHPHTLTSGHACTLIRCAFSLRHIYRPALVETSRSCPQGWVSVLSTLELTG